MTQKAQAMEEKIDKVVFIKIKTFCAPKKQYIKRERKNTIEWEKIFLQIMHLIRDSI